MFLLREFTKMHEQQILGTALDVAAALEEPVRGEIVFVIEAAAEKPIAAPPQAGDIDRAIDALLATGLSTSAVAKQLADEGLGERRHLYSRVTERRRAGQDPSEA